MKYAKKGKKNRRALIGVIIALAAILIALLVLVNVLKNKTQVPFEEGTKISVPWDSFGSKKPKDYTWEEFEALTPEQSIAFQNYLGESGFEAWMQEAQKQITIPVPWDEDGAKQPEDYTWEEFEALTPEQSIAFQNHLGESGFEAWMQEAQNQITIPVPWDEDGAKQPEDYTWEEFEALAPDQSIAFQNYLGESGFEAWMNKVREPEQVPESEPSPWEEDGAKQPEDYTWEEFEALTPEQSIAFQNSFDSFEDFDAWMQKALEEAENAP